MDCKPLTIPWSTVFNPRALGRSLAWLSIGDLIQGMVIEPLTPDLGLGFHSGKD